jgi:hypothetical protein
MRYLVLCATIAGSLLAAQLAHAVSANGSIAGAYDAGPGGEPQYQANPPDPSNCGTPDEPRPCGPMPRHPMHHYTPH